MSELSGFTCAELLGEVRRRTDREWLGGRWMALSVAQLVNRAEMFDQAMGRHPAGSRRRSGESTPRLERRWGR